ncbi:MAG: MBL fold metallo-hydrolase [Proteobacteria bacterium]|nr:MBL fold metallo-hydrolase [Pseudomonadota bacterium]
MQFFPASTEPGSPDVAALYDKATGSWQYIVSDPGTGEALIVDPVLDFDAKAAATGTANAEALLAQIEAKGLKVGLIVDTHPHADHLSAAAWLAGRLGARMATGQRVLGVQRLWADYYADDNLADRPEYWDRLFADEDGFSLGGLKGRVVLAAGHTTVSVTLQVGDAVFAHDTLMMPDSGTARADFPGGSAEVLWQTIRETLDLPEETRVFIGHDYGKDGREPACMATVGAHRQENIHVRDGVSRETFLRLRAERDATLPLPDRMLMALQVNLRGGRLPEPDAKGRRVLRVPLDRFDARG